MKTLKLSVQLSAASFVALVLPFLLFSVCGLAVPHITVTFARWALYLLPAVIVLLLIYCNAVGVRVFVHGLRSGSWSTLVKALLYLVVVGFVVATLIRVLWPK
jgi:hypothetical protein